jgi:hypothetical protein
MALVTATLADVNVLGLDVARAELRGRFLLNKAGQDADGQNKEERGDGCCWELHDYSLYLFILFYGNHRYFIRLAILCRLGPLVEK